MTRALSGPGYIRMQCGILGVEVARGNGRWPYKARMQVMEMAAVAAATGVADVVDLATYHDAPYWFSCGEHLTNRQCIAAIRLCAMAAAGPKGGV